MCDALIAPVSRKVHQRPTTTLGWEKQIAGKEGDGGRKRGEGAAIAASAAGTGCKRGVS